MAKKPPLNGAALLWIALAALLVALAVQYARSLIPAGDDLAIAGAPYPVGGADVTGVKARYGDAQPGADVDLPRDAHRRWSRGHAGAPAAFRDRHRHYSNT